MRFGLIFNFSVDSLNDPANQTKEKLGTEGTIDASKDMTIG